MPSSPSRHSSGRIPIRPRRLAPSAALGLLLASTARRARCCCLILRRRVAFHRGQSQHRRTRRSQQSLGSRRLHVLALLLSFLAALYGWDRLLTHRRRDVHAGLGVALVAAWRDVCASGRSSCSARDLAALSPFSRASACDDRHLSLTFATRAISA